MTLYIAVVGAGWAGERQIEASQQVSGFNVVAVVDPDLDRATEVGQKFGIEDCVADLDDVLADPDIDAVSICSPHRFHHPQAIQTFDAGKHVLCEKPLAITVTEGEEMVARAEEADRKLFVAESEVYRNLTSKLAELISADSVGTISSVSVNRGFSAMDFRYSGRRSWLTDPSQGGTGTWMLHGVHTVAQLRYLFGDIARIVLHESHTPQFARNDIEATVSGFLITTDGLPISLIQSTESPLNSVAATYRIHGIEGVLIGGDAGVEAHKPDVSPVTMTLQPDGIDPYVRELEAFVSYVESGKGPTPGYSELQTLRVIEAGYRSMATGLPVDLISAVSP